MAAIEDDELDIIGFVGEDMPETVVFSFRDRRHPGKIYSKCSVRRQFDGTIYSV